MRKLVMIAALLVLVLAVAAPALALNPFKAGSSNINNGVGQEDQSGNVDLSFSVQQSGNNSSQCVTPQQFGNTGSQQNAQPILQYNSVADGALGDIKPEGSTFNFAPELTAPCNQAVQQSSSASG